MFNNENHFAEWKKLDEAVQENSPTACTNDPDGFFPEKTGMPSNWQSIQEACNNCPIQKQCADYGVHWEPNQGIWGGLSIIERRQIRKKLNITTSAPHNLAALL